MDKTTEYEILKNEALRFQQHLSDTTNSKIIFSGKFGSGKTTFLNVFFETPEMVGLQSKYTSFRIVPTHYVIASNENIINYIKYDLITEILLKQEIEVIESDLADIKTLSEKDVTNLLKVILSMVNFKGIEIDKLVKGLERFKKLLDKKREEISESHTFLQYLDKLEDEPGLFENDVITKTLSRVLKRSKNEGKETVLIIDDFDRIDPEHIFRILNIFSSHFDEELYNRRGKLNKFEFDKVILVLDFNNLKSLFSVKFGQDCDFNGYIDKFYNKSVYNYDIRQALAEYLGIYINQKISIADRKMFGSELNYFARNIDSDFLEKFLLYAFQSGLLTFRKLDKLQSQNLSILYPQLDNIVYGRRRPSYTGFQLKLLFHFFGNTEEIINDLEKLEEFGYSVMLDPHLLGFITDLLDKEKRSRTSGEYRVVIKGITFIIEYIEQSGEKQVGNINIHDAKEAPVPFQIRSKYASILFVHFLKQLRKMHFVP